MTDPAHVTGRPGRTTTALTLALSLAVGLTACVQGQAPGRSTSTSASTPASTLAPPPTPGQTPAVALQPTGETTTIQTGLSSPWSMLVLPSGSTLISERDSGRILERPADGGTRTAGTVPGVLHHGEGGLLGLAAPKATGGGDPAFVYAYLTTTEDNRVVRMPLGGTAGHYALGAPQEILTGIPKASNHNGGRIAFGPDGMLYITVGDASRPDNAQSLRSLGGKILRITADGANPIDNPFPDSPVYSLGHRNPQGIGWDARGTMWSSEFGQNTWDELNIITPGANYGWPIVEGIGHQTPYVDPVYQWPTDLASPSGLAVAGDTIFMAALGGKRLWVLYPTAGAAVQAVQWYPDAFGRLRDVAVVDGAAVVDGPGGGQALWLLTNNTDGRGTPREGDDRIVQVTLGPRQ
ncbi:MAG: PQQ-dependent sugar dehydrogenase [Microbacteriaceae bacterium]